jgi:hypothetical protein
VVLWSGLGSRSATKFAFASSVTSIKVSFVSMGEYQAHHCGFDSIPSAGNHLHGHPLFVPAMDIFISEVVCFPVARQVVARGVKKPKLKDMYMYSYH